MVSSIINDAKKLAYLTRLYPAKTLQDILAMLIMPALSKDCAVWSAIDQGWVEVDKEKKTIKALEKVTPNEDESISAIMERIIMGLRHQNAIEEDVDEVVFLEWFIGFLPHDVLVAINMLLDDEKLLNYEIMDGENKYVFYTLPENETKEWGKKRFKSQKGLQAKTKNELDL